jgi:hypothetical protein
MSCRKPMPMSCRKPMPMSCRKPMPMSCRKPLCGVLEGTHAERTMPTWLRDRAPMWLRAHAKVVRGRLGVSCEKDT